MSQLSTFFPLNPGPTSNVTFGSVTTGAVTASGPLSGAGFTNLLAAPPAIGNTTPNSGAFTTLTGSTQIIGPQGSNVGTTSAPAISVGASNTGIYVSSGQLAFVKGGSLVAYFDNTSRFIVVGNNGMSLQSTGAPISFSGRATGLTPEVNGTLALVSTTQAQTFRIYNTFTDASNYERGFMRWSSNVLQIGTEAAGTGTLRGLNIGTATSSLVGFYGVTPVDQPATVADPAGGGTVDTEARTAIGEVIDRLQELGLIA